MNLETALKFVDNVLQKKANRNLRNPEIVVFRGTWQGMTYEHMASLSIYSANYLMRDVAPKFWKLLSVTFEESISKTNLLIKISNIYDLLNIEPENTDEIQLGSRYPVEDWGSSPVVPHSFCGRERELDEMEEWIGKDKCQVIKVWGLSGVGKTLVMKRLGEQIKSKYQVIIWRSLLFRPSLTDLIRDLLRSGFDIVEENNSKLLLEFIGAMRSHSCLIMLDGVEAIFQPDALSGKYLPGYEDYYEFFQVLGKSPHQSCVITTSLENYNKRVDNKDYPVRTLKLSGLSASESKCLLQQENLANQQVEKQLADLIEYYQGNPSISNFIVQVIEELFNDNIEVFLAQNFIVTGEINRLVLKSFNRLSKLELEILYWLAGELEPASLEEIKANIPFFIDFIKLFEALESLSNRSLVEAIFTNNKSVFILSPMIREFVTNQFIAQIEDDITLVGRVNVLLNPNTVELGTVKTQATQLSKWLQEKPTSNWQPVRSLFNLERRSPLRLKSIFNLRDKEIIKRFKQIKLNGNNNLFFLLLIGVSQEDSIFNIVAQLQPELLQQILPDKITISLINSKQNNLVTVAANLKDSFIQLYFKAAKKEKFQITIKLNSYICQEEFLL